MSVVPVALAALAASPLPLKSFHLQQKNNLGIYGLMIQ